MQPRVPRGPKSLGEVLLEGKLGTPQRTEMCGLTLKIAMAAVTPRSLLLPPLNVSKMGGGDAACTAFSHT